MGREKVSKSTTALIKYSDRGTVLHEGSWSNSTDGDPIYQDTLYAIFEDMEYMINIPNLKAHERAGVSMFGKNHFGSHTRDDAKHLHGGLISPTASEELRNTYRLYRVQVDLMAHKLLGKKNLFYLMDALYCSDMSTTRPSKWQIPPFNNDWTSSIFISQDPVAIESVGFDFLYAQYDSTNGLNNYPHLGAVDDYLHQLADSTQWPTGIVYDPENDGTSIGYSQGVHEHWNNITDKKYSRNLGTGQGIELIQEFMPLQNDTIPVTGVTINHESLSLTSGQTSPLTVTISPSNATDQSVSWSSGNTAVATVSSSGVVTAVAAGSTTITVTTADGGKTDTCAVTVKGPANLALHKTAISSSDEDEGLAAYYATDGDYGSRWGSAFSSPEWIYVDLGALFSVTRVKLFWEAACATSYKVQVSSDASAWTDVYGTTTGDGGTDDLGIAATSARYVRMYGTVRSTEYGYSLYEFEVYGDTVDTQTPTAPTGLNSPSQTLTGISLAWGASTDNVGVTGYDIYKDGAYAASSTTTSCTIESLVAGTAYTFTVKAKDAAGNYSEASNALTVSTLAVPVTGVTISPSGLSLTVGSTATLTASVSPPDATNRSVSWSSNNTDVATVSSSGLVTAVATGSTTITVTTADGGKTDTCTVTIIIPITSITLSPASLLTTPGETSTLVADIFPSDATNKTISWTSDNTNIATIDANGMLTAVGGGTTTITVAAGDGTQTASCTIIVTIPVTGITLSSSSLSLTTGQTSVLTSTISPANASNQAVTWSSSNSSVATVDSNGVVKAISTGTANITVTSQDGSKTASCKVSVSAQTITGIEAGVSGTISCRNTFVTLSTISDSSYANYKWSGPDNYSSTVKSPTVSVPGIYTLTANDTVNNCTVTAITNVLQNTLKPNSWASSNGTLSCGTKTVSLKVTTSSPNTVVTWDGQNMGQNPVTMEWPGQYFATTTDTTNGCSKRDSVTVNQYITYSPVQFYNNTFSAYANETVADNSTNGWYLDRSNIPNLATVYGQNTTPHYFAVYSKRLIAQQLGGEGIWYSKVMDVSGKPNFQIGINMATEGTLTSNDYVKLFYKLDGGPEIAWDSKTGAFSYDFRSPLLNANTVQIVVKIYSTVKGGSSVSNHYLLQYQLYVQDCGTSLGVYTSSSGDINCANPSVTLYANSSHSGTTYKWTGPNEFSSTEQYPVISVPGTYTVTASMPTTANPDLTSSTATGTVTVLQNITAPGAFVGVPDTITSQKKYVALSGNSATSGVYYSWEGPNNFVSNQQNPVVITTGTYKLTVINPVNGCYSSADVNVAQNIFKSELLSPATMDQKENHEKREQPVLNIYPNPTGDMLFLKTTGVNTINSIKILDIRGSTISIPSASNNSSLNVSMLKSGIYILIVETEQHIFRKMFIKQ